MFKQKIEPGLTFTLEKTVEQKDTASAYGSGGVDVFATPAMISLMENTALQIDKLLEDGFVTVGTEICVKHIKATPIGGKVTCTATLKDIQGPKLLFEVEAYDEQGKIGFGTHKRYIVNLSEFMKGIKN